MLTPTWPDCVPTLIDPERRITLRAHHFDDLTRIVETCVDPGFEAWTTTPAPYTAADARYFLESQIPAAVNDGTAMLWAIESAGGTGYCGTMEIRLHGDRRGGIAYGLHPDARGRGIAVRAGRLALDWAFDVAALEVVSWQTIVGNWASRHVAAALGFRFEGVQRRGMIQRGVLVDAWNASLLRTDPRETLAPVRQPVLSNDRVVLRPFAEFDLDRITEACSDPLTQQWLPEIPRTYGRAEAAEFWDWCREGAATFTQWTWCVTTPGDDTCRGAVTLFRLGTDAGELGYWAHPDSRGHGLLGAAARLVADHVLATGRHHLLTIQVAEDNQASRAVARRTGARECGRLPEADVAGDGKRRDLIVYARVAGRS